MFGISLARISLLTGTSLGGGVGVSPTLDLNFRGQGYSAAMAGYTFNQLIDFTRTSAATYVDATGKIVPTAASRNLLTFTQEFDNAGWTKTNAAVQANVLLQSQDFQTTWSFGGTVTPDQATAPDGSLTADLVAITGASAVTQSPTLVPSAVYTVSVYLKAATASENVVVRFATISGTAYSARVNVSNGTVTNSSTEPFTSTTIAPLGNGWYRFTGTGTAVTSDGRVQIYPNAGVGGFTGGASGSVYLWGAQLVPGTTPGDYQRTTTATVALPYTAPDGTLTADTLVENTAAGVHYISETVTGTSVGATYTASVYAKPNGRNWIILEMSGATIYASFNVATGAVGTTLGSPTTTITPVGNGWYRCSMTKAIGAGISAIRVYTASADNTTSYTGDGTSGIYLWGAQLETGSTATDYTRNNGGVYPPRFDYDPVTLAPKGLLVEEQRTNLFTYSEQFDNASWLKNADGVASAPVVTANFGVSPDGTANAVRVQFALNGGTTSTDRSLLTQSVTMTNATAYTFTIWLRSLGGSVSMGIGMDGVAGNTPITVTSTWQRFTLSGTSTRTSGFPWLHLRGGQSPVQANAADILVWGAQLEAGSFATSYIPTVASQVTRTADVATITGANFSQWHNLSEGTWVVSASGRIGAGGSAVIAATRTSGASNLAPQIDITTSTTTRGVFTDAGGSIVANASATVTSTSVTNNYAVAYSSAGAAIVANGGTVSTSTLTSIPSPTSLNIGGLQSTQFLNGHIRSVRFFPTRLSNAQLQALTA